VLTVLDQPIIPFIRGDGTYPDIWAASEKKVMDAALEKAYGGKKKIAWMEGATQIKCSEFGDNIIAHM